MISNTLQKKLTKVLQEKVDLENQVSGSELSFRSREISGESGRAGVEKFEGWAGAKPLRQFFVSSYFGKSGPTFIGTIRRERDSGFGQERLETVT